MQLTKKDVVGMVGIIKANYSYAYKDVAKEDMLMLIETWYLSLARYEKEVINVAFQKALESCKVPPTLADIIEQTNRIKEATEPSDTELWAKLTQKLKKVADCVYRFRFNAIQANGLTEGENARREFETIWQGLPQVLKEYCGDRNALIALSKYTDDELSFEKGRFIKILPTLKRNIETRQTINPDVLQLASGAVKQLGGGVNLLPLSDTEN